MTASRTASPIRLAALLALVLLAGCKPSVEQSPQERVKSSLDIIELPKGTIAARPGSSEAKLAAFLASNEAAPQTFRFNASEFSPWSDVLSKETKETLSNVIIILNNYPRARLRIAGYTDDDGVAAANQTLSQQRVDALEKLMVTRGIDQARIEAVGMGAANPVASNATPAGRAANRRIEITVTSK